MRDISVMSKLPFQKSRPTRTTHSGSNMVVRETDALLCEVTLQDLLIIQGAETYVLIICESDIVPEWTGSVSDDDSPVVEWNAGCYVRCQAIHNVLVLTVLLT